MPRTLSKSLQKLFAKERLTKRLLGRPRRTSFALARKIQKIVGKSISKG
jgi:hypothetical protein